MQEALTNAPYRTVPTRQDDVTVDTLIKQYNTTMRDILNRHAPEREAVLAIKTRAPWYTEEIAEAKRSRRSLEKQWKRTNLTVHHDLFKQQRNKVTALIKSTRAKFYCGRVEECNGDQKALFGIVDKLLHRKNAEPSDDLDALKMSEFFEEKIEQIWNKLQAVAPDSAAVVSDITMSYTPRLN